MTDLLSQEELFTLLSTIKNSNRIVICAHRGPDGDAVGSSLGLYHYLKQIGKRDIAVIMPNPFPDFLRWMPDTHAITFYSKDAARATQTIASADLIFCLDFNDFARLDDMGNAIARAKADKVMIDHHEDPKMTNATKVAISRPQASSACLLVFNLIRQLGGYEEMTVKCGDCLMGGMMTDTGCLSYNSNDTELYEAIGMLIRKGVDKDAICRNVTNVLSMDALKLRGYILGEKLKFYAGGKASVYTLTREEMLRFNFVRGDAEGIVNIPLSVKGMRLSIQLREDTDSDEIRVSTRSVGNFSCKDLCERYFQGGGHFNAAGGKFVGTLDDALLQAEKAIREMMGE